VLKELDRLRPDELVGHITEDDADGEEALVGLIDVAEPLVSPVSSRTIFCTIEIETSWRVQSRFPWCGGRGSDFG